jgi:hypothetical protein
MKPNFSFALLLGLLAVTLAGCTSTHRSAKVAEGRVVLDIAPIQVDVQVDTTRTLLGVAKTTVILGVFKRAERVHAVYPAMDFGRGPGRSEKTAAVAKALQGTDFDVLVNPKFIVQERRGLFVTTTTCQVAGFGGKFEFQ